MPQHLCEDFRDSAASRGLQPDFSSQREGKRISRHREAGAAACSSIVLERKKRAKLGLPHCDICQVPLQSRAQSQRRKRGESTAGHCSRNVAQRGEKYLNATSAGNQGPALGLRDSKENKTALTAGGNFDLCLHQVGPREETLGRKMKAVKGSQDRSP